MRIAPIVAVVAGMLGLAADEAQATPMNPFIDLQEAGLALSHDAVGLAELGTGTRTLTVPVGGSVRFALLYWTGRDQPCPGSPGPCSITQPYKDQQVVFGGSSITGTVIGTEQQASQPGSGRANHIGYFADVTAIVAGAAGSPRSFTISDGANANELDQLDGAALLVAYTQPGETRSFRVLVQDGMDFAYGLAAAGEERETAAATLGYAATPEVRRAQLLVAAGGGTAPGLDALDVGGRGIGGCLDGSEGPAFDLDELPVTLAPGSTSLALRVVSPAGQATADQLRWAMVALRVPIGPGHNDAGPADTCTKAPAAPPPAPPTAPPAAPPAVVPAFARDLVPPRLSAVALSRTRFRAASSGASIAGRRTAVGTTLRYTLSEPAAVTMAVVRRRPGRRSGRRCVTPSPRNRGARRCTRTVALRPAVRLPGAAGSNRAVFRGRIGGRRLGAGAYAMTLTATDGARNRTTRALRFSVVSR